MSYSMHTLWTVPSRVLRDGYDDPEELREFVPVYEDQGIPVAIVDNDTDQEYYATDTHGG